MTLLGGTFVVGVTTTPDPIRTVVLGLDLEPAAAGALARLLANHLGWSGPRRDLAAALNLSEAALRVILADLEGQGLAVRERFNVEGRWCYALAVTDTTGRLPSREELRAIFRNGGNTTWTDANEAVTPSRSAARSQISPVAPTCDDAAKPQVSTYDRNGHVNRFPSSHDAAPRGGRAASMQPVNRLSPVPESDEVRAHGARSVISSMAELEALARMRGAKCSDGGRFRTSREVRDVARTLDQNVVDDGLGLLAGLGLPFWVAPEVWVLLTGGWSPDRVGALLDGVHSADSPHGVARYRLARAAAEGPAPAPAAPAEPSTPPSLDGLVDRDANHLTPSWSEQAENVDEADTAPGAAPWDRAAAESVQNRRRYGGFRAPTVPTVHGMAEVYEQRATLREGEHSPAPGYGRRILDNWKSARRDGTDNRRDWVEAAGVPTVS